MSTFFTSPLKLVGGTAIGTGVGVGVSGAIMPIIQQLTNEAWARYLSMPIGVIESAMLVASGERDMAWGVDEARNTGFGEDRFRALVDMVDEAPDLGTLFDLLHRRLISADEFREGAKKGMIEDKWLDALIALAERVLSPAEAANAFVQGYMSEAEASAEAALSGVSPERSNIQRLTAGLPPGPMDGLTMLRRNILDEGEYAQLVREGHTKVKYIEKLLALRTKILSGAEWAGLWLRGWATEAEAKAGGALDGWDAEAMDRLYENRGRPATVRQVHVGFARGGRHPTEGGNELNTLKRAIRQSNVRTEWEDLLIAQRYTYPSAFVVRGLAADGTFDEPTVRTILVESGWKPEWAELAAAKWTGGDAGPSTKWADRARARLFTVAHTEYLDESIDAATAGNVLARVGATPAERATILAIWDAEAGITRRELTPASIRKAYRAGIYDEATALSELEERGMTSEDARTFLAAG